MNRIVVDVDTQRDFMVEGGALHVPARASVAAAIRAELESGDPVVGSVDSHAYDAWEFADNGGPFAPHCIKGTPGWLRVFHDLPKRTRFVPLQTVGDRVRNVVGERTQGAGNRELDAAGLAQEVLGGIGVYFEKEVYSLFANPAAPPVLEALVGALGGPASVRFDVIGYCTGGYCVDAAALGLRSRGYNVRVLTAATGAIGGEAGAASSKAKLSAAGVDWVD